MVEFDDAPELDESSVELCEIITAHHIKTDIIMQTKKASVELIDLTVSGKIRKQERPAPPEPEVDQQSDGMRKERVLQAKKPLLITFIIYVVFRSIVSYSQEEMNGLVGGAFNSDADRDQYIADLQETDDSAFSPVS